MQAILDTRTTITRVGNAISIFTYYNDTGSIDYLFFFISDTQGSKNGTSFNEGDLVYEKDGYDDIKVNLTSFGELLVESDSDKTFSINSDGELIMEVT